MATPRFLAVGGRDLLILDAKNVLWRWRASNDAGKGRLNKVNVNGATQWGDDITAIGTYLRDVDRGLANLYVVDPSEEQIRVYFAALDGSGYPAKATGWLATARDVSQMNSMYIDGDMFVVEGGVLERFASGKSDGWEPAELPDALLREQPDASLVTGQGERREGTVFTYDREHARLVEYEKASGNYLSAVPPRRGCRGLEGHARHVRAAGCRGRATRGVLGVAHVLQQGVPGADRRRGHTLGLARPRVERLARNRRPPLRPRPE